MSKYFILGTLITFVINVEAYLIGYFFTKGKLYASNELESSDE